MRNHFNFWKNSITSKSETYCIILLFAVAIIYTGCKEEQLTIDQHDLVISTRGDGGSLSTAELIDLLGTSCIPDSVIGLGGCDTVLVSDTVVITLPDYPGCSFTVEYKYYSCRFNYHVGIFLADFQIISYNCPAFTTAINNAYNAGETAFNEFIGNFDYDVASQIQLSILYSQYPGVYDCNYQLRLVIYQYTRASCFKNCRIVYPNGSVSNEKIVCGSGCCIQRIEACMDENGNWVIEKNNYSSYPYCDNPPIFQKNPLPIHCTSETQCTLTCPGED